MMMAYFKYCLAAVFVFAAFSMAISQEQISEPPKYHFDGDISLTNNGFSLVPTFSLGKPAAIAVLSVGGEKFSFDPQFRFDLNGLRPWSFIFIWRYKFIDNDKFYFRLGAHLPAIAFVYEEYTANGLTQERLIPRRFITPEVTANFKLADEISVGLYYLYGIGLEKENQTRHTHFIALTGAFTRIELSRTLYMKFLPQVYYLTLDGTDGFYAAHSLEVVHDNFPVSVGTMMNLEIDSDIVTDTFQWNVSLIYSFDNDFVKKRK